MSLKFITILFSLAATISIDAFATTLIYKSVDDLVDTAEHIVLGEIKKITAKEEEDGNIYTYLILTNANTVNSDGVYPIADNVKIRHIGGAIESYVEGKGIVRSGLTVTGIPTFKKGDKVLLFISNNGISKFPFTGFNQGVLFIDENDELLDSKKIKVVGIDQGNFIKKDNDGKIYNVHNPHSGTALVNALDNGAFIISSDGGDDIISTNNDYNPSSDIQVLKSQRLGVADFLSRIKERKSLFSSIRKSTLSLTQLPPVTKNKSISDGKLRNRGKPNDSTNLMLYGTQKPLSRAKENNSNSH